MTTEQEKKIDKVIDQNEMILKELEKSNSFQEKTYAKILEDLKDLQDANRLHTVA